MNLADIMLVALVAGALLAVITIWRAHRSLFVQFNAFDLLMENGKVSKIAVAFMLVLLVTTWVVIQLTVRDKLTEGYFLAYGGMWVAPLVTKVVFNKNDLPGTSSSTTVVQQTTTEVTQP